MQGRLMLLVVLMHLVAGDYCIAQSSPDSMIAMSSKLQGKYLDAVSAKSTKASEQIDRQTEKYLAKLEKQEQKIKRKLAKLDSSAATRVFGDMEKRYSDIQGKVKGKAGSLTQRGQQYFPWLDSASTSLKFIDNNPMLANIKDGAVQVKKAIGKVKELQNQFRQAESARDFIRQRKEYLKEQLRTYNNLGGELKKYNQTAYYYSQQINEYREVLNDPDKAEKKVLELLRKLPAFKDFFSKNSFLARIIGNDIPVNAGAMAGTATTVGLQSRLAVEQMIQSQIGNGGPNVQGMLQQNVHSAQSIMDMLRDKISSLGGNSNSPDLEMPEFNVNPQKTKTFMQRLEYGANLQTTRSNYYFPTTTDIAVSLGYKINNKSTAGIGLGYKAGWGKDIKHISFSSEGVSFRSFLDVKLKGSFYVSGGLEYNYQQSFYAANELYDLNKWQKSGLLGMSKIISLKTKVLKKTKIQFLWDFLSYSQRPVTQPLKFRVGYSF